MCILGVADPTNSDACITNTEISGCTDIKPTVGDTSKFEFAYWSCKTPTVTAIDPVNGTSTTEVTITGAGFSTTDCQNDVIAY